MVNEDDERSRGLSAWVVTQVLGKTSEVWILRQVMRFQRCWPKVLYWERFTDGWYDVNGFEAVQVPFVSQPHEGAGRWWYRARQLHRGNFYGAVGAERAFLQKLAEDNRPDVILTHFGQIGLRVLPVAQKMGVPVVVHFHGLDLSSMLRNRWYRWSLEKSLPRFAQSVVVGSHQRELLLEWGVPAETIHLIPCGVPTEEFTPRPAPEVGQPVRFLCVSRLVEWKGVRETIFSFESMLKQWPEAELAIVGDGDQREKLVALVKERNLEGKVRITGPLPPEEKDALLRGADVFLQHSLVSRSGWVEGFGVSVAEASATGLPVIVTRSGGLMDQVIDGETGLLVEQRDIQGMAEAMLKLARDPELRARMGRAGRNRMVEMYDTTKQVAKLEDILVRAARQ